MKLKDDTTTKPKVDMSEFEVNISKKNGEIQIPSQWISYMVVNLIFHYYFEINIWTTYKMIYNNDPAEVQEYA